MGTGFDEGKITSASQAYIQVAIKMKGFADLDNSPIKMMFVDGALVIPRQYITSAEFSGISIGARQSKITCLDPDGTIADSLGYIGAWANDKQNKLKPNVKVVYGWIGSGQKTNTVHYVLISTVFSMREDGLATVELNLQECYEAALDNITIRSFDDLKACNTWTEQGEKLLKNQDIISIMTAITKLSGIAQQLGPQPNGANIDIEFTDKVQGSNKPIPVKNDHDFKKESFELRTSMGDSLKKILDELSTHIFPLNIDENMSYSYEIIKKKYKGEGFVNGAILTYGWVVMSKLDENGGEVNIAPVSGGKDKYDKCEDGGVLKWKELDKLGSDEKVLLSFDLNLEALNVAAHMVNGSQLGSLRDYTQSQWDVLMNIKDSEGRSIDDLVAEQVAGNGKAVEPVFKVDGGWQQRLFGVKINGEKYKTKEIEAAVLTFTTDLKNVATNIQSHIDNVILRNVFRAKARILGDPMIAGNDSSSIHVCESYFSVILGSSYFAEKFNGRKWILVKATHIIDESGYFTDLELMGLPETGGGGGGMSNSQKFNSTNISALSPQ
jgi:hypothetical protein